MHTVTLKNGNQVPAVGLGTWFLGDSSQKFEQERDALLAGVDAGCRLIDTAEMYGDGRSEKLVGTVLHQSRRDDIFLVSKVLPSHADKETLPVRFYRSLDRLDTDYLDLYLLHWYGCIPLDETIEAMEDLVREGVLRSWGVSNLDTKQMNELWSYPHGENCQVDQVLYHVASRGIEYELLPQLRHHDTSVMAYCPLAQGGTLRQGKGLLKDSLLTSIAEAHHVCVAAIMLAFIIRDGHTIAIPRSGKAEHNLANAQALTVKLTDKEIAAIDSRFPAPNYSTPLDIE